MHADIFKAVKGVPSPPGTHVHRLVHDVLLPSFTRSNMSAVASEPQAAVELLLVHGAHQVLVVDGAGDRAVPVSQSHRDLKGRQVRQVFALEQSQHLEALHRLVTVHFQALGQRLVALAGRF